VLDARLVAKIANDVRGAVDGWVFTQYVLSTLFYRFISENFASYIEGCDKSIHMAKNIAAKSLFKFSLLLALATTLQKS
jgi:type I restriction-modification system DNA methylase subunit